MAIVDFDPRLHPEPSLWVTGEGRALAHLEDAEVERIAVRVVALLEERLLRAVLLREATPDEVKQEWSLPV